MSSAGKNETLDPYTASAVKNDHTPQQKIDGLKEILKVVKTGMLTSRDASGNFHSRAMTPTSRSSIVSCIWNIKELICLRFVLATSNTQLNLVFLANSASHKFDELANDPHVNVSFYDEKSTNWASFAGTAKVSKDRELIKEHWSPM